MAKTIANVLSGVATLNIREPNNARAEWQNDQYQAGTHSVKLIKTGVGNAGSTHLQLGPTGANAALTLQAMETAVIGGAPVYTFYHMPQNGVTGNYAQFEMRFEDPNSEGWIEVTFVNLQGLPGDGLWVIETLADGDMVGYGGVSDVGHSFFEWGLRDINGLVAAAEGAGVANCTLGDWVLSRIRLEMWEAEPARTQYIDTVVVHGVAYAIEPGNATAVGLSLSSPYTEVGYTEDGVNFEYNAETTDIMVEEESFAIDRILEKESLAITCNMAEASLYNMDKAMAGSLLAGSILKLGAGTMKTMNIMVEGTNPAGFKRQIHIPLCTSMGSVGMPYKKGEKTVVPVSFGALKSSGSPAVTIVDNAG